MGGDDTAESVIDDLTVALVAAVAENRVIGDGEGMPWHYPADLAHFKETTMGHPVVLGRRTFESIADRLDGPLPGRTNVVLTSGDLPAYADHPDVRVVGSVDEAVEAARETGAGTVYVAGGGSVYEQFLPLADRMVLTEIPESPDGDVVFPTWDDEEWVEVDRERAGDLAFVTYERR